ncbi:MAG: Inner membrane protein translocase component YidC, long form [Candidatus Jettenia ecosi]|uniref:Membrane protein insertase YidC n=1 Tax=Candidatus Jettenia ecosi TaxID=2494326 RepID=A0A533Q6N1_9BACT|nr:MAG: Inner membrane protein translocase component YidC, long form [Candidatus Jettenia ecosi]
MDKKTLIAMIICGVIMLLYYPFILPLLSKKPAPPQGAVEPISEKTREQEKKVVGKPGQSAIMPAESIKPQTEIPRKEIIIENELVKMVWTNEGAVLKSVKLKRFKDPEAKETLELLKGDTTEYRPLAIDTILGKSDFREWRYTVAEHSKDKIVFTCSLEEGINIMKTISLPPEKYHVNMDVVLENKTDDEVSLAYSVIASSMIMHEGEPSTDMAAVAGVDMGNKRIKLVSTSPKNLPLKNESVGISWAGSMNKYFATILKPASSDWVGAVNAQAFDAQGIPINEKAEHGDFMVSIQTNKLRIPPHDMVKHSYLYFVGPKKEEILKHYETLDALLTYGWLNAISKALLAFLNAVHRVLPNYGLSIIVLTILIKMILFPLTKKSQVSMFRMQQLQPMINQLKEKYKHDKQRMGKEQMLLFKKYGANPMSGCLPMLLQLPVFFALFRTLQLSFEMRQAPFVLWINDLSRPDTLMTLPFTIPFIGNALNILPLVMTGASFVQMKTTPKAPAADPQAQAQQKMMSFMPIMFAFILYNMPSGLTLYWTVSTVFSIIEGIIIRKSIKKIKIK